MGKEHTLEEIWNTFSKRYDLGTVQVSIKIVDNVQILTAWVNHPMHAFDSQGELEDCLRNYDLQYVDHNKAEGGIIPIRVQRLS